MIRTDLDPPTDTSLPDAARLLDLRIPEECVPGVRMALDALAQHWRNLAAFPVPE